MRVPSDDFYLDFVVRIDAVGTLAGGHSLAGTHVSVVPVGRAARHVVHLACPAAAKHAPKHLHRGGDERVDVVIDGQTERWQDEGALEFVSVGGKKKKPNFPHRSKKEAEKGVPYARNV